MKKKILSVVLAAIMTMTIASASFSAFAAENQVYKIITTVNADNTLTVDVILPGSANSTGGSVIIGYNKANLTYKDGEAASAAGSVNPDFVYGGKKVIFLNNVGVKAFKVDTKMGTITFTMNNGVVNKSDIKILAYEVTNEKSETIGSEAGGAITPDFVCPHANKTWKVTTPATCTADGVETEVCNVCGEGSATRAISATGHSFGEWAVTTPATCTAEGLETRTCSVCGAVETRAIAKIAHSFGEWTVTTPATCTAEGVETRTCSVCGEVETRVIPKTAHKTGEWTVVKEATCTEAGSRTSTCSECKEVITEVIPAKGHTNTEWTVVKEATCTEDGSRTSTCDVCKEVITEVIPAKGHDFGEWTVEKAATLDAEGLEVRVCATCGEKETRVIPKLAPVVTEPTTEPAKKDEPKIPATGTESVIAKTLVALFSVATLAGVTVAGKKLTKKEK